MARVWDPLVRVFHWSLVASFATAWFSWRNAEVLHMWAGYAAGGLVGLRLLWGVVGTPHARFASFVKSPRAILTYLLDIARGTEARHIGHNPAGGAMILALMLTMAATALTGWMQYTPTYYGEDWVTNLHSLLAHAILVLVLLHLAGVGLASLRHRENLVRAMITGRKRLPGPGDVA